MENTKIKINTKKAKPSVRERGNSVQERREGEPSCEESVGPTKRKSSFLKFLPIIK